MGKKGKKMPKYIERDSFVEWLKKIPLKDLSDGLGLCRVIMEDDFKKAIKNIPESIIHDYEVVVRCRDCIGQSTWLKDAETGCEICGMSGMYPKGEFDFCSYGERKGGDGNG